MTINITKGQTSDGNCIAYRSVTSRRHDNALPGSKRPMFRCWIAVKTGHCFVPDCIQHAQIVVLYRLPKEPKVKATLQITRFTDVSIQSITVHSHSAIVVVYCSRYLLC